VKKWQAELLGHEFDLMDLPTTFLEVRMRVLEEGGHFYLEAGELEATTPLEFEALGDWERRERESAPG